MQIEHSNPKANRHVSLVLVIVCLLTLLSFSGFQQTTAADKPTAGKQTTTPKRRKAQGRLPNYYGKVGLSSAQRTTIYAIQKKYSAQSQALIKQLLALRAQRQTEIDAVLTAEQATRVKTLRNAAAKKRAAGKKKRPRQK